MQAGWLLSMRASYGFVAVKVGDVGDVLHVVDESVVETAAVHHVAVGCLGHYARAEAV